MAGSKFEFLTRPSVVSLFAAADIAGGAQGVGLLDLTLGNVVAGDDLRIPITQVLGAGPERNQHLVTNAVGAAGDRIQLRVRETGGAQTLTTRLQVDIKEIA